jgi:NAD(P)-dependent dehydrogenase (short-subunit alcohol dehydrogenase family)
MNRMETKRVLIIGGSTGFGYAIAELFVREKAEVAIAARNRTKGRDAVQQIKENTGKEIKFIACDITKENEVVDMLAIFIKEFGKIDVLINNAGFLDWKEFEETTGDEWDKSIDTNLKGYFYSIKNAVPYMIKQHGGVIINMSSVVGLVGKGYNPIYSTSKGGVTLMTRSLALRYAKYNIRVNCICPGTIITDLNRRRIEDAPNPDEAMKNIISEYPLGRLGKAQDIAYAALYLASDESQWVTGIALPIDGGYTAGR